MALNSYCKLPNALLAITAVCLSLPGLWAQASAIVSVETPKTLVLKRGASAEAKIAVSVKPGFHVNSNTPSDAYLIPLKLTWTPGGLQPGDVTFPKPQM